MSYKLTATDNQGRTVLKYTYRTDSEKKVIRKKKTMEKKHPSFEWRIIKL